MSTTSYVEVDFTRYEVPAPVGSAYVDLRGRLDDASARIAQLESQLTEREQRLDAQRADFTGAVRHRAFLERAAVSVLGGRDRYDGLSDRALREKAIKAVKKDFDCEGRSDDYIESLFDALVVNARRNDGIALVQSAIISNLEQRGDAARLAQNGSNSSSLDARLQRAEEKLTGQGTAKGDR